MDSVANFESGLHGQRSVSAAWHRGCSNLQFAALLGAGILLIGCSASSFDGQRSLTSKKSTPTSSEGEPADEPQSIAGTYLLGCGPADTAVEPPSKAGWTMVGCGVYDKASRAQISDRVTFDSVRFQDSSGHTETADKGAIITAPAESGYHVFMPMPADMVANMIAVDGVFAIANKKYKGTFTIQKHVHDWSALDPGSHAEPSQPCAGPTFTRVPDLTLVSPTNIDSFSQPASNLLDGKDHTPWNADNQNLMIVKLSWTAAVPVCAVNIIPDYGYNLDFGRVNSGQFNVKVQVGDSFNANGDLVNPTEIVADHQLPVTRQVPFSLTPTSRPAAAAAIITISNCGPSYCAAMEVEVVK